jgi:hypothetical protein
MSLDVGTVLRVLEACDAEITAEPLISLVFPKPGGGSGQVFLKWEQGKMVKEYLRDPVLAGKLSLYQAAYSRIVDHRNVKRRLSHTLKAGDELRFIRTSPTSEM